MLSVPVMSRGGAGAAARVRGGPGGGVGVVRVVVAHGADRVWFTAW
ncbi:MULTISPECIES: hypothetical protein [unclassified Streptomyces]|nr:MULTISPECIES: hypothetical protein [unclassified Streptomyces]MYT68256.1 hypothetical protein [Streptomyces sp. SID8367]